MDCMRFKNMIAVEFEALVLQMVCSVTVINVGVYRSGSPLLTQWKFIVKVGILGQGL
jgi:hypothetical protein